MPDLQIILPQFVIDSNLSSLFSKQLPNYLGTTSGRIAFDWREVHFFDDYTLLKLIYIQRQMRRNGIRVRNTGFRFALMYPNVQAVLKQLWAVGLPEIIASGHLYTGSQLNEVLEDDAELLGSNPFYGMNELTAEATVIPMLCCHDNKHFTAGSREEKELEAFIRACLRPGRSDSESWDLIEDNEFRYKMLQQLRRNVHEHSRIGGTEAIGLAITRIWTKQSLGNEWLLSNDVINKLMNLWGVQPIPIVLNKLDHNQGVLQISVIDDGAGIPHGLRKIHDQLVDKKAQLDLIRDRLHYNKSDLNERFAEPATWEDENSRLIAFATDELGSCKLNRANELKGLHYMRETTVIKKLGAACIESGDSAISDFSAVNTFGKPRKNQLRWCIDEGAGISLAVPMVPVKTYNDIRKYIPRAIKSESKEKFFRVKDYLIPMTSDDISETLYSISDDFKNAISEQIVLVEPVASIDDLKKEGLIVVDWGELPDSKRVFESLFSSIAVVLAGVSSQSLRPFVFANLPKGLCGLLENTINMFSKPDITPICVFASEQEQPFWLGLEGKDVVTAKLYDQTAIFKQRKLTGIFESNSESFYRSCIENLLYHGPLPLSKSINLKKNTTSGTYDIAQSAAYSQLEKFVERCALFRKQEKIASDGDLHFTGAYIPVFKFDEITAIVRNLFIDKFRIVFTNPPICFTPKNTNEGIRLPHSSRIVRRYFRSDALVDSPIAMELTQELSSIALDIANLFFNGRIDWVVSCTSPLHWFVHKIVDGLADKGVYCAHHVFSSYEDIIPSIDEIGMCPGDTVLVFTDVIASGQTSLRMAESLVNHHKVRMAGLIALADIRSKNDRENDRALDEVYQGRIVCLYNEFDSEPDSSQKLDPAYYVHPETVVPKREKDDPNQDFFGTNYSGFGPLVEGHTFFSPAKNALELMAKLNAVHYGHYQHGSHHSEVFVDVEKVLSFGIYRGLIVTALFRYIITNDIRLVIYPSHSSAYVLADELKQRFSAGGLPVEFVIACRTFVGKGTRGTSYALTRFTPDPAHLSWKDYSNNAVLILDDAVCSGATVESIMAELARIDRKYYDNQNAVALTNNDSKFSVHVVAFLNRLPRVSGDFWQSLSRIAKNKIFISSFVSIPLSSDSEEICPQCQLVRRLEQVSESDTYCLYAKEFLLWWIELNRIVLSHERRHFDSRQIKENQKHERFNSDEVLRIAGYLSAIDRKARAFVLDKFKTYKPGESKSVYIHVWTRGVFLYDILNNPQNKADVIINELEKLVCMTLDDNGKLQLRDDALDILQVLTVRYLRTTPNKNEIVKVIVCLINKYANSFEDRLLVCGIACVLDTCTSWFKKPFQNEWLETRCILKEEIAKVENSDLSQWAFDWLSVYLTDDGQTLSSLGKAVQILASYAQKGRQYHYYGRSDLDQLLKEIELPVLDKAGSSAPLIVHRVQTSCDQFSQMLVATRALRSKSAISDSDLIDLQKLTGTNIVKMREYCDNFQTNKNNGDTLREAYTNLCAIFKDTYLLWFPIDSKAKAVQIIGYFLPFIAETVDSALQEFKASSDSGNDFIIDNDGLNAHKGLKVIIDPEVLKLAIGHILSNIERLKNIGSQPQISWDVYEIDDNERGVSRKMIGLKVSNTDTPRPNFHNLTLRGLHEVNRRLEEFGGKLVVNDPDLPWSFQVVIYLQRWSEVTI